ncbi:MAG: CAP domain-containing protein [Methanomicrobiales archaeon]|nr:CAP domain-containing protein [Methanomicrobiales archaeon]
MKKNNISTGFVILFCILLFFFPGSTLADKESADLGIVSIDVQPSSAPGSPFYGSITVVNYGGMISMSRSAIFYLSTDSIITPADYEIGSVQFSFLRPDESAHREILTTLPGMIPPGTYYAGAALGRGFSLTPDPEDSNDVMTGRNVTITRSYTRPQEWYNDKIADIIFNLSNEERVLRKLAPLTRNTALDIIALDHSRDMSSRKFFDHTNPDGEDPADRADRHHYNQERRLTDGSLFYGIGENIVKIPVEKNVFGFGEIYSDDPDEIGRVAVESFMDSPPHKEALLLPAHEKIGIGVAYDGEYYYATQNFF